MVSTAATPTPEAPPTQIDLPTSDEEARPTPPIYPATEDLSSQELNCLEATGWLAPPLPHFSSPDELPAPHQEVPRAELAALSQEEDFQKLVAPPAGDIAPPTSTELDKGTKRDISTTTAHPLHDKRLRSTTRTSGGEAAPQPDTISILSLFSGIVTDIRVLLSILAKLGMVPWVAKM